MPVSAEEKGREQRQGGGEKGEKEEGKMGKGRSQRLQNTNVYTNIYCSLRLFSRGINI